MSEGTLSNVVVVDWGDGVVFSKLGVGEGGCGAGTGSIKGGNCKGWRSTNLRSNSSYVSRSMTIRVLMQLAIGEDRRVQEPDEGFGIKLKAGSA